jgi:hypothetical protein
MEPRGCNRWQSAVRQRDAGWRLYYVDNGEVAIYCPRCAEREFCDSGADFVPPPFHHGS